MSNVLSKLFSDAKNRWKSVTNPEHKKANLNWLKIRKLKFLNLNKPGVFQLKGRNFHFTSGPELLHSLKEIFVGDIYKMKFDTGTPYIIDCGANMGMSILYYKQMAPDARIVAFEPDVNNFELLKKNVEELSGVKIYNQAVWKENIILKFAASGTLSSKIVTETTTNTIDVQAVRLKDYLVEPVDFFKN